MHFCTLNKYAMKITNDILKDYFYDKCSHEEEIEIQKWLTENDNSLVDQSFREIISEIQIENHELSQKAFEKFQKATQQIGRASCRERV